MRADRTAGTIVARASPEGKGAIAVLRLSGPDAGRILETVTQFGKASAVKRSRRLVLGWVIDGMGRRVDEVLAVFMPGPHSYTGEDVAEVFCHGGSAVVSAVLEILVEAGARPALPGEFTRRAFEAGRVDLTRAEAVVRLIDSGSEAEVRGAARVLGGELERVARGLKERMMAIVARTEAGIDFCEDVDAFETEVAELDELERESERLQASVRCQQGAGTEVVIAGLPNVGKSSLVNALAGREISIVTAEAGTTRDAVSATVVMGRELVVLVDTAGQDSQNGCSLAAREAARVAARKVEQADLVLWVTDGINEIKKELSILPPVLRVVNKADLMAREDKNRARTLLESTGAMLVSAKTGEGIKELSARIGRWAEERFGPTDGMPVSSRQRADIGRIRDGIRKGRECLELGQPELALVDLKDALDGVVGILGEKVGDEILDRIFSSFCIGK